MSSGVPESELEYRIVRLYQMMHLIFSKFEVDRGYGGDLPASPYAPLLEEIEEVMDEYGVIPIPKERALAEQVIIVE